MVDGPREWGLYGKWAIHTKGYCWKAPSLTDAIEPHSLANKKAYYYDDPDNPGNLTYCEDCLREMGVLW